MIMTRQDLLARKQHDITFTKTIAAMARNFKDLALSEHECNTCGRTLTDAEMPAFLAKQVCAWSLFTVFITLRY